MHVSEYIHAYLAAWVVPLENKWVVFTHDHLFFQHVTVQMALYKPCTSSNALLDPRAELVVLSLDSAKHWILVEWYDSGMFIRVSASI